MIEFPGANLIYAERERQVREEGYSAVHDEGHAHELALAGVSYAAFASVTINNGYSPEEAMKASGLIPPMWPWEAESWKPTGEPAIDLMKAGALIAAAIDSVLGEDPDAN